MFSRIIGVSLWGVLVFVPDNVLAGELRSSVEQLLENHKRVVAAKSDLQAAKERSEASYGDWYPTLDATTSYGYEEQNKGKGTDDTAMPPRVLELSLSQLIYDFGATNAAIDRSRIEVTQSTHSLESTRQNLSLEALNAHLNVLRQRRLLRFNQGSIANVKRQMQLEDARVQRGSGLATDVLQAKSQLAGLEATKTRIQGALRNAINRYRAVYNEEPTAPQGSEAITLPRVPEDLLPRSLNEAIDIAMEENPQLKATYLGTLITKQNIIETKADEFYPTLSASAERNLKRDEGGTVGGKQETLFMVELSYSLNLGMTATNTLRASELTHDAGVNRYKEEKDLVEEKVRNAWNDLETARLRSQQLSNQTNIASEFLELARRERQLGNRSLIDVLAGETALINATSDAASAEVDVIQAAYRLLTQMGRLTTDAIDG